MMTYADVIIVGGGPAGSTCAWKLQQKGLDCLLLDKQDFPRSKPCGGWLMPEVLKDLAIEPGEYPHDLMSFEYYHVHFRYFNLHLKSLQYAIRRHDFDNWLLKRSAVPVLKHRVSEIRQDSGYYVIDDQYKCKYLVGAGGTNCPVYRTLFMSANPRAQELQAVTMVDEFAHDRASADLHLWFSLHLLPGYAWYVPKSANIVNVGIGTLRPRLQKNKNSLKTEWDYLVKRVAALSLVKGYRYNPRGFVYYLRNNIDVYRIDNAFLIGDAAGLATRDMAEGIGPAVKSGIQAAASIAEGHDYDLHFIKKYSSGNRLLNRFTEYFLTD
jgi:flavin-dependent dehydrogenase